MLLVNKKEIVEESPSGKYIRAEISKIIDQYGEYVEVESYLYKQKKRKTEDGKLVKTPLLCFGTRETLSIPGFGNVIVDYVDGYPDLDNAGNFKVRKKLIHVDERLKVNVQNDPEKAFFILKCSRAMKEGMIKIVDLAEEDKKELEKTTDESMVRFMIAHPNSPISPESCGSEEKLRDLAASWGVTESAVKALPTLRKEFISKVLTSEKNKDATKRGFDQFASDVNAITKGNDEEIKVRKLITMAIDDNKILHRENTVVMFPGTSAEKILLKHRPTEGDIWVIKTVEHLMGNAKDLADLNEELNFADNMSNEEKKRNFESLSLADKIKNVDLIKSYPQLKKLCNDETGDSSGKMEDMKKRLIEHYKAQV